MSQKKESTHRYPLWVRALAIALACLTASGVLTYVILFISNLF